MNDFITRITSVMLVFGFFISCTTLSSTTESTNFSKDLSEQQLQQKIDSLNIKLESGEVTGEILYQKGSLLTTLARKKKDPSQRTSLYLKANQSLTQASEFYSSRNQEDEKAEELLQVSWSNEHNQGVQIMQRDSIDAKPDYRQAATHFKNATVIIPDSAISYQMEARAYYNLQQTDQAIDALQRAQDSIHATPPSELLEQLAFLYLENDQSNQAIKVYEQAKPFSEQNLNLLHGLSNAYMKANQHRKAADILELLTENRPENILYGQSLATELFHIASEKIDTVVTELKGGKEFGQTKAANADSLLSQAENQYTRLLDKNPENQELKYNFAQFYQNCGAIYQQVLPLLKGEQQQKIEDMIQQYLLASLPLYENVAEERDEPEIWETIYHIYSYLGMQEEAQKVKANF